MNQPTPSSLAWVLDALKSFDVLLASGGSVAAPCGLADDELMAACVQVESLGRIVDALRVQVAGEVAARSDASYGDEGLARSHNFRDASSFLAAVTGERCRTVRARLRVASETHTTFSLAGMPNPPHFPRVAEALSRGELGVDAATVIVSRLSAVVSRVGFTEELSEAESALVGVAQQSVGGFRYSADEVDAVATHVVTHLDPDGAEPREADLHARRYLTLTPHRSGMTKLLGLLPPSMAATMLAALEPFMSPRVSFDAPPAPADAAGPASDACHPDAAGSHPDAPPTPADDTAGRDAVPVDDLTRDTRTRGQKLADALEHVFAVAAGSPSMPRLNGAAPTVNLHTTLEDVVTGRAIGWVDGLTEPVLHSTVEELLCHADIITTLFGQHGQVLQHGKTKRLFTTAQNRALAARDGGCVWPGCDKPPSWCESHHVDGWLAESHPGGRTDIDNGVLLCHFHHTNVHKAKWTLTMQGGTPHLIPPDWLDWTQTPRPCQQNRARQMPGANPPAANPPGSYPGTLPPAANPPDTQLSGTHPPGAHLPIADRPGVRSSIIRPRPPHPSHPPRAPHLPQSPPVSPPPFTDPQADNG